METHPQLGRTDRDILSRLQAQAKLTNAQLAQDIGLSPASTLERVRKLERRGLIKSYHAKLAPEKLGLHTHVMVQIKLHSLTEASVSKFKQAIAQLTEVVACYQLVGEADFLVQIFTQDLVAYQDLVMHKLSTIEGIQHIKPFVITATLKETGISTAEASA
ncbi:MAG: Lrp/AsnC family transcriptional regulator [Roseivirga sp.]